MLGPGDMTMDRPSENLQEIVEHVNRQPEGEQGS